MGIHNGRMQSGSFFVTLNMKTYHYFAHTAILLVMDFLVVSRIIPIAAKMMPMIITIKKNNEVDLGFVLINLGKSIDLRLLRDNENWM